MLPEPIVQDATPAQYQGDPETPGPPHSPTPEVKQMSTTLEDRLNADFATAWKPDPDGLLIGEVVELSERDGGFGSYPIITVKQDDGELLAFHAYHTVAASQLAAARPAIGARIGIRYKGKIDGGGTHGSYHGYRIVTDHPAGTSIDWSKYGEAAEQPADQGPARPATDDDDCPF